MTLKMSNHRVQVVLFQVWIVLNGIIVAQGVKAETTWSTVVIIKDTSEDGCLLTKAVTALPNKLEWNDLSRIAPKGSSAVTNL